LSGLSKVLTTGRMNAHNTRRRLGKTLSLAIFNKFPVISRQIWRNLSNGCFQKTRNSGLQLIKYSINWLSCCCWNKNSRTRTSPKPPTSDHTKLKSHLSPAFKKRHGPSQPKEHPNSKSYHHKKLLILITLTLKGKLLILMTLTLKGKLLILMTLTLKGKLLIFITLNLENCQSFVRSNKCPKSGSQPKTYADPRGRKLLGHRSS
jgi:hypothetical protein